MRQLQPVLWNKGAFLQPQHLQAQDLYLESRLQFCLDALSGYPYGFKTLTVDTTRLAAGYFAITSASGVFPDGLLFDIPDCDREPEARRIDRIPEGQDSLVVSLGVPQYRNGMSNVSFTAQDKATSRYLADCLELRDDNTGSDEKPKPIQIARRNLVLLLPHDDTSGYCVLPVARIIKKGATYQLDRDFIPPVLQIGASPALSAMLNHLTGILAARSQELSQTRKSNYQGLAELTGSDTASFWLLYTVNSHYPVFRYYLAAQQTHPCELFARMQVLAGALSAFTLQVDPNDLPDYRHDDLEGCFRELDTRLRRLLDTAIPRYTVSLPLLPTELPYVYKASIPQDRFLTDSRIFLAIQAAMKPEQLMTIAPAVAKIASSAQIDSIINSAVPGVPISRPTAVPNTIRLRQGYQYFELERAGAYWDGILRSRSVAVYLPDRVREPKMELVILLKTPL